MLCHHLLDTMPETGHLRVGNRYLTHERRSLLPGTLKHERAVFGLHRNTTFTKCTHFMR